jgi:heme-degrading monooxygenase HmoA
MAVRVIIEREVKPEQEPKLRDLMTRTRMKALRAEGYISGETVRAMDNPNKYIILSNWNSVEDWKAWEKSPERLELEQEIEPLLKHRGKCTVYIHL